MNSLSQRKRTAAESRSKYTSLAGGYAFRTYDVRPPHRDEGLLPEDILAANLLSLQLSAGDAIPLFAEGDGAQQKLLEAMNSALAALKGGYAAEPSREPCVFAPLRARLAARL